MYKTMCYEIININYIDFLAKGKGRSCHFENGILTCMISLFGPTRNGHKPSRRKSDQETQE